MQCEMQIVTFLTCIEYDIRQQSSADSNKLLAQEIHNAYGPLYFSCAMGPKGHVMAPER